MSKHSARRSSIASIKKKGSIIVSKEIGEFLIPIVKMMASGDLPDGDEAIRKSTSTKSEKKTSSTNCSIDKPSKSTTSPSNVSVASDTGLLHEFPTSIPKSNTIAMLDTHAAVKRREHRLSIRSPTERRVSIAGREGLPYHRKESNSSVPYKISGELQNKLSGDLPDSSKSDDLPDSEHSQRKESEDGNTSSGSNPERKKSIDPTEPKTEFKSNLGIISRRMSNQLNHIPEGLRKKSGELPDESSTKKPSGDLPEDLEDSRDGESASKRLVDVPLESFRHRQPFKNSTNKRYSISLNKRQSAESMEKQSGDLPETESSKQSIEQDTSPKNTIKKSSGKKINESRQIPETVLIEEKE
ncbi:hypothetical protein HK103_006050 [Boothiomyces macroporosus]|uniref:Uncharacterized protein n=1 Tax=Boothiomyces macroporosus TaxID=261099 RepID=A0AAD5UIK7_9FUNG|nr:hypothetical protein HK103_006050 [Boothiomyces macroporosus]